MKQRDRKDEIPEKKPQRKRKEKAEIFLLVIVLICGSIPAFSKAQVIRRQVAIRTYSLPPYNDGVVREINTGVNESDVEGEEQRRCGDFVYFLNNGKATITGYFGNGTVKEIEQLVIPQTVDGYPVIKIASYGFDCDRTMDLQGKEYLNTLKFKTLVIPEGIQNIGHDAFAGSRLSQIQFPESLKRLQGFSYCQNLQQVTLPKGLKTLFAFDCCENLQEIEIPGGVKGINCFAGCINLRKVTLHEGLKYIWDDAFSYCSNLERVEIPSSIKKVGAAAFVGTEKKKIIIRSMKTKYTRFDPGEDIIWCYPGSATEKRYSRSRTDGTIHYLKPGLSEKRPTLSIGEEKILVMYGARQHVTWKIGNKRIARIVKNYGEQKGTVLLKGKANGTTTLTAQVGKKKYTCKVKCRNYTGEQ